MAAILQDLFHLVPSHKLVLYPPFLKKWQQLLLNCDARGVRYYATCGERSFVESDDLYAQGRTKPGKIVSNSRGGQSAHNYLVAGDSCRDVDRVKYGLQPSWKKEEYEVYAQEAEKLGLESGLRYKSIIDGPHVQLPLSRHGILLFPRFGVKKPDLLTAYLSGGHPAVFAILDKIAW